MDYKRVLLLLIIILEIILLYLQIQNNFKYFINNNKLTIKLDTNTISNKLPINIHELIIITKRDIEKIFDDKEIVFVNDFGNINIEFFNNVDVNNYIIKNNKIMINENNILDIDYYSLILHDIFLPIKTPTPKKNIFVINIRDNYAYLG
ncbi:hypothetical protein [Alphaentomopoxvirus acuprea]|uniref:Uncharacterized protein n=1 Tax=Alphaentomopoxvirus acuprea TaxID=62099 RepID=W6JL79_9POXV|nr:hypothetical protein BA82_gp021 [Anomala cuprea entomopoxvirus]YP_009001716.1 hypothetical protein BA82_gp243 [Anomala cuprea entomopoxvirus]BAO49381.1 hypothetical protein [Anomala cuprea entomopoxvirus]BAO49603.1 hypothetical protein [Anomala cuprea entomopoxvirus]